MPQQSIGNGVSMCPSAQPEMSGATIFGVIQGTPTEPCVGYLDRAVPLTPEISALTNPVPATEVFRIGAPCAGECCVHFADNRCSLATRLVQLLPAVVSSAPPCVLRPACMWWRQEGIAGCERCPQIVTHMYGASDVLKEAASPAGKL